MSYIDAECPECSEQFEVYEDDDCDECLILEQQIADLEMTQLSEEQEKKLEEYDRLKTWLLRGNVKLSELILGLDHYVAMEISNFMAYRAIYHCIVTQKEQDIMSSLVKQRMATL